MFYYQYINQPHMKLTKELHDRAISGDILLRMIFGAKRFDAYIAKNTAGNQDFII